MQPMKRMIQGMLLSASALAFVAAPATLTPVFAQDTAATPAAGQCNLEERDKLYNDKFYPNYSLTKATAQQQEIAYQAAKEYVAKFPNCENQPQIDFINKWIPKYEELVKSRKFEALANSFNEKVKAKDTAGVFTTGKEVLAVRPDYMNVNLYIVDAGYQSAQKKVNTYNAETVALAKQLINDINNGKTPPDNNWSPFTSKDETLAWMNYTVGFVTHNTNKKEAAPYFYKTVQLNSPLKNSYFPYLFIAEMYLDEYTKAAKDYETQKESTDVELVKKLIGTYKAYADRAIEAYAKAYTVAKAEKKDDVAKAIYDGELTQFYKLRHDGQTTGMTEFVAAQASKSLTDPTTPVTPVIETTPTTATTPAASTTITASTKTTDTAAPSKTASTNGVKTAAANGAKTTTATAKPAAAKKPVAKKRN